MFFFIAGNDKENEHSFQLSAEQAFLKYSDMVWRLAVSKTASQTYADDILQEVFMSYLRKKPLFVDEEHCKAWLLRVTINCSNNLLKSSWIRRFSTLEDVFSTSIQEESPVYSEVLKLPQKYRTVIHLHYYEGYSVREISEICRAKESTVKTWLLRGRKQLELVMKGEF